MREWLSLLICGGPFLVILIIAFLINHFDIHNPPDWERLDQRARRRRRREDKKQKNA